MASVKDTASFFANGNTKQFDYCYKLYPEVLKLKAEARSKKPEELIKLDNWYQFELPKLIKQRGKDAHMVHEELVQCMKWKQSRGKFYPQLSYLIKVNTPRAVMQETKKAFKKLPNLELAITALSNLKGVGTTMASALLAAAAPDRAPFMADECLMAIPEIEGIDYTTKEYLNFVQHIQTTVDRLNSEKDSNSSWTPHRVELALWTHYVARDLKPEFLDDMPNLTTTSNKFSSVSGEEDDNDDSVIDGVVTGDNDIADATTEIKQTNGGGNGDGNGDGGGGIDSASITTDENSISNDSQDAVIDSANNTQTSIENNKISETSSTEATSITTTIKTNVEQLQPIIHNLKDTNESNTLQPIHHHLQSHDEISSPMLLVNDDTTTASSTTAEEDNTTTTTGGEPLNTVISDESNLEPPPLQQNPVATEVATANGNNNGNGALDSLDESSTRSEDDSLEKPMTKGSVPPAVDENSDSLSSAKRSIDCCDSESNSQPESKKIRSD